MVRLRMQRLGRRHRPFFRINAVDQRTRRDGKVLETIGHYDPLAPDESKQIVLQEERIRFWLEKGARPSETVRDMLGKADLLPEKLRAEWEKDREMARKRVDAKRAAQAEAEAAAASAEGGAG